MTPAGTSVVVGIGSAGLTLSPDGRYAIVCNDDQRLGAVRSAIDPLTYGGSSLAVVDTQSMLVVDRFRDPAVQFSSGIVALDDPAQPGRTVVFATGGPNNLVYPFVLDANGKLTLDQAPPIALDGPFAAMFADAVRAFPVSLAPSADGRKIYVVNQLGGTVVTIDVGSRTLVGTQRVTGDFPIGVATVGDRLLVTNEGLMRYAALPAPSTTPPFRTTGADLARASSLSIFSLTDDGSLASATADVPPMISSVPMDQTPDGIRNVGGAHPTAILASPDKKFAYVAMAGVDRIAVVDLSQAKVVGGAELRLFDRGPYGTQPTAFASSKDGSRLYVALTGIDAVAVIDSRDPLHLHRLGLIPTGWAPGALSLSADDRTLFVANAKGLGEDANFAGDVATNADAHAIWGTLERIDLATVHLADTTRGALANLRRVASSMPRYPTGITDVVLIEMPSATFDSVFGDLGNGPADPTYSLFGQSVTPNLHALARRFALAGNFYADAEDAAVGHQVALAGTATPYTERTVGMAAGRRPPAAANQDPEDYPRSGYIFNALARRGVSFRDYGELLRVSGYDDGRAENPRLDDPEVRGPEDLLAPTSGLGGIYGLDVPALAVLAGHVDLAYPGWNPRIRDQRRAAEFVRDFRALTKAGKRPRFSVVWLPGVGPRGVPTIESVADADAALGTIVGSISHQSSWAHTAIIVMPLDASGARDHVDEHRSYALVISPYAKHTAIGMRHTSTASALKTIEGLLHLAPLSLGDLLATDLSDLFKNTADLRPYTPAQPLR